MVLLGSRGSVNPRRAKSLEGCGVMNDGDESPGIQESKISRITLLLKDMFTNDGGLYFLKFHDEVGLSLKGISALASNLRKPIIMDDMTTKICVKGEGRIGFARVLVKLDAREMIKDKIDVDKETNQEKCHKNGKNGNIELEKNNNGKGILENKTVGQNEKGDSTITMSKNEIGLRSYNIFTLLESLVNEEELVPSIKQIKVVDEILRRKIDVSDSDMNGWNVKMKRYYKDRKELFDVAPESERDKDIIDGLSEA
uniref:ATPase, F1/V1/A1 complex, alpha/beta subunit, zinc knuckle CX2CX4HX4C n=1 Tax=Tanacetum cinerariifolium TaxID=118510 RepID=A0A6L2MRL6_TANCI|nr:ATPase, F1/V1/A1 complex, alpha/beta subunit, zinc knuckle CX2CX4HX4C [Tanacetum cinerariifolium]